MSIRRNSKTSSISGARNFFLFHIFSHALLQFVQDKEAHVVPQIEHFQYKWIESIPPESAFDSKVERDALVRFVEGTFEASKDVSARFKEGRFILETLMRKWLLL